MRPPQQSNMSDLTALVEAGLDDGLHHTALVKLVREEHNVALLDGIRLTREILGLLVAKQYPGAEAAYIALKNLGR